MKNQRLIGTKEASKLLGVKRVNVPKLMRQHNKTHVGRNGKSYLYRMEDVQAVSKKQKQFSLDEVMTTPDIAKMLGVSPKSVSRLLVRYGVEKVGSVGHNHVFLKTDIQKVKKKREKEKTPVAKEEKKVHSPNTSWRNWEKREKDSRPILTGKDADILQQRADMLTSAKTVVVVKMNGMGWGVREACNAIFDWPRTAVWLNNKPPVCGVVEECQFVTLWGIRVPEPLVERVKHLSAASIKGAVAGTTRELSFDLSDADSLSEIQDYYSAWRDGVLSRVLYQEVDEVD